MFLPVCIRIYLFKLPACENAALHTEQVNILNRCVLACVSSNCLLVRMLLYRLSKQILFTSIFHSIQALRLRLKFDSDWPQTLKEQSAFFIQSAASHNNFVMSKIADINNMYTGQTKRA